MAKPTTKTQVPATRDDQPGQLAPAFMKADINRGKENIDSTDIDVPRIKLLQALSPELEEYNSARPGNFLHTGAEHLFKGPFLAVPVFYEKRYLLWNPRDNGGGILARADDGVHWSPANQEFAVKLDKKDGSAQVKWKTAATVDESGLAAWGSMNPADPNSPPAATRMLSFLLAFPNNLEVGPAVLTFQRSSIKVGRKFLTKIKTVRAPIFGMVFEFSPVEETNRAGQKFWNVGVQGRGLLHDEKLYVACKELHESFSKTGIKIRDEEGLQGEGAETGDDAADEPEDVAPGKKGATGHPRY